MKVRNSNVETAISPNSTNPFNDEVVERHERHPAIDGDQSKELVGANTRAMVRELADELFCKYLTCFIALQKVENQITTLNYCRQSVLLRTQ